jgi:hypothetical protein
VSRWRTALRRPECWTGQHHSERAGRQPQPRSITTPRRRCCSSVRSHKPANGPVAVDSRPDLRNGTADRCLRWPTRSAPHRRLSDLGGRARPPASQGICAPTTRPYRWVRSRARAGHRTSASSAVATKPSSYAGATGPFTWMGHALVGRIGNRSKRCQGIAEASAIRTMKTYQGAARDRTPPRAEFPDD